MLRRHHRSALRLSSLSSTATTIRRSLELATFAMVAAPDPRPPALIVTSPVPPWFGLRDQLLPRQQRAAVLGRDGIVRTRFDEGLVGEGVLCLRVGRVTQRSMETGEGESGGGTPNQAGKESDASTVEEEERKMSGGKMETRTLLDEIRDMDNGWLFDFGHPLINRVAECFFKAAGIGAVQAVTREAYFTAVEGQHRRLSYVCMQVKGTGKESFQWGAALALTADDTSHEQIVQCAITGAALSTAANLLSGIF
ncbi:hypothetical protein B296_00023250 [Ensete ventricosum]|uniref:Uncharacterized protein n=1 Tax=Ensete ventricosum TaxID=4639 RepID=A0A426Z3W7_ENSVE|nr:hypothetical protein B296_00023250 [Ensete ventricosum]